MATWDRQIPSPDPFLCEPWSSFVRAAELHCVDYLSKNQETEIVISDSQTVPLSREEMLIYRPLPDLEGRSLVVCHICDQVVTPHGILTHYEKRHSSAAVSSRGGPLGPVKPMKALAVSPAAPGVPEALSFRVPKDFPHSRFSRAPLAVYPPKGARTKPCVSLPVVSLEKIPGLHKTASPIRLPPSSSSSSSSTSSSYTSSPSRVKLSLTQRTGEKLSNGHSSSSSSSSSSSITTTGPPAAADRRPSPARSPLGRRPPPSAPSPSRSPSLNRRPPPSPRPPGAASPGTKTTPSPSPDRKQQNGSKAPPRAHRCLSGRVFDPNKHCGVQDPETKRQCTRSLTCKTHSLTQRRAVLGRKRTFDLLLAEHKGRTKKEKEAQEEAKRDRDRDGAQGKKEALTSSQTTTPSRPHCPNGRLLSTLKLRLANAHIPRVPGPSSICAPPQPSAATVVSLTTNPPHAEPPECGARLSSDDNEEDEGKGATESPDTDADRPPCPLYAARHPRPLGCCRFGSRLMGRGSYVFDRRWDRVRLALHTMVEKHLNAHMWRKVPLACETPLSPRTPASPSLDPHPHPYHPFHPTPAASTLHTPPPPPPLSSPQSAAPRDRVQPAALASPRGKPRDGMHAPNGGGGPWGGRGDQAAGARKRKMAASSTSSSSLGSPSSSSSSPTSSPGVDINLWKIGNGVAPGSRAAPPQPTPGWKRSLVRGVRGPGGRKEEQTSRREEGPKGYGLLYRQGPGAPNGPSGTSFSLKNDPGPVPPHMTPAPPFSSSSSSPLLLGQGGGACEGRKRRSPGTPGGGGAGRGRGEGGGGGEGGERRGKASRGLESLFRRSNGTGGILSSGPPSP